MAACGLERRAAGATRAGLRQLAGRAGVSTVEFAILMPVFLLTIFGIIELALMEWTHAALQHATEMAARCAAVNATTCGTAANIESYAAGQAYGLTVPSSAFTYSTSPCNHKVSTTAPGYAFSFIVPLYGTVIVNLNASSCYS